LQLGNPRLAGTHSFFADALPFARIGHVQAELLRHARGNGRAARAGIEQKVEGTATIDVRFNENAIIHEVKWQREGSLRIGEGAMRSGSRKRKRARAES